jgi:hypothetical protein
MYWVKIDDKQANKILDYCHNNNFSVSYTPKNRIISCINPLIQKEVKLRHSLHSAFLDEDVRLISIDFQNQVVVSIKSGIAALAFYENFELVDHKVFRAYMVRKKQGKSQIKHLKTKGKSRAGSRVRLQETLEFFEQINERLQYYFQNRRVDLIALGCSPTLLPYFYQSKIRPPFEKSDPRLFKIPVHIPSATLENLQKAYRAMSATKLWVDDHNKDFIRPFLNEDEDQANHPDENW